MPDEKISPFSKVTSRRSTDETVPPYPGVGPKYVKNSKSQHTWTMEACAVVLSLATLLTILILLVYADGLALTKYNFFISFNAVVSILGAIARVSLGFAISSCLGQGKWNFFKRKPGSIVAFEKFEDASRGPWGSLWLMTWLGLR